MTDDRSPFQWPRSSQSSLRSTFAGFGLSVLERCCGLTRLARLHEQIGPVLDPLAYVDEALRRLGVTVDVNEREADRIPRCGRTLVVSNHPFGLLDGLLLLRVLLRVRPDVRVLANELLARIPALAATILPVDVLGREGGGVVNRRALRAAIDFVETGGLLAVFPSGAVAHAKLRRPGVHEDSWHSSIARDARTRPSFRSTSTAATARCSRPRGSSTPASAR